MALHYGNKIVTKDLLLYLDAANPGSYNPLSAVEVLVVAGGGGGGMDMGGGGGGGGVIYNPAYQVASNSAITVTVGAGGWGAPTGGAYRGDGVGPQAGSHQFTVSATAGGNSVFGSLTAIGGGFGASSYYGYTPNYGTGGTGGSGGGCSGYTHGGRRTVDNGTVDQGYSGGDSGDPASGANSHYSGGGGGASQAGADGPARPNGGAGVRYLQMSPYYFAGGGGGVTHGASSGNGGHGGLGGGGGGASWEGSGGLGDTNGIFPATNGAAGAQVPGGHAGKNTGGGGGGGTHYNYNNAGGNGGSGIVIVRYPGPPAATGGTITQVDGFTHHTFYESGTFTPKAWTEWRDLSGNGWVATMSNLSENNWVTNNGTKVFETNDTDNQGFRITGFPFPQNGRTYEIWLNSKSYGVGWQTWFDDGGGERILFGTNTNTVFVYPSNNFTANLVAGEWYHIAYTLTGAQNSTATAYKNGESLGSGTFTYPLATSGTLYLLGDGGGEVTSGYYGVIRVYDRCLTAAEIQQNFNAQKSRFIR